jgi:uncharacterized membrane protein
VGQRVVAAALSGTLGSWRYAPLVGWDAAAATFAAGVWTAVAPMDPDQTAEHARREDPTRASTDVLLLTASVAILIAVSVVGIAANSAHGSTEGLLAGLAAASVALSWLVVHTLFTLRYARLYHSGARGGVNLN